MYSSMNGIERRSMLSGDGAGRQHSFNYKYYEEDFSYIPYRMTG